MIFKILTIMVCVLNNSCILFNCYFHGFICLINIDNWIQRNMTPNKSKAKCYETFKKHQMREMVYILGEYRPPEIVMKQSNKKALSSIDTWSVGAIFGELLQMIKVCKPDPSQRRPLFQLKKSKYDQMRVIFNVIGVPVSMKLKTIQYTVHCSSNSNVFKEFLFGISHDGLHLIQNLLAFDANKRYTIDQALQHPFITDIHTKLNKSSEISNAMDSYASNYGGFDTQKLRKLILIEIYKYSQPSNKLLSIYAHKCVGTCISNDIIDIIQKYYGHLWY